MQKKEKDKSKLDCEGPIMVYQNNRKTKQAKLNNELLCHRHAAKHFR